MSKQTRREFLFNIGVTAITATTGFAMSAVRVEETELTKVEQQYAEMLSREQDLPYDIQAGIDAMESYIAGFDVSLFCSGQVNEDRIVEAFTISKVQAQSHRLDALHYVYGNLSECNVDFRIQYGHCDDKLVGTVESVNEDGSVNVRLNDAVSIDFDGWMYSDGTS